MIRRKRIRQALVWCLTGLGAVALVTLALNEWVVRSTRDRVFADLTGLPTNDVALVLGTGRLLQSGRVNPHFRERVITAAVLFHEGKVRHLLLSGDNHVKSYDEPADMKEALLALDVPASAMTLDCAGFRTLDSVVRAREVFGQGKVTIVTDDFHAARAVFSATHSDLQAVAFCSASVPASSSARSRVREVAARVKAVLDLYVLRTQPHFLGDPVEIRTAAIEEDAI